MARVNFISLLWFGFDPVPGKPIGKIAAIAALMAICWITEPIPGWTNLLNLSSSVDDGTIAIAMSLLLFLIPARKEDEKSRIITNVIIKKIPWDVVLLFGGGFALAQGLTTTGLSQWFGDWRCI